MPTRRSDRQIYRQLIRVLKESNDPVVLAVAAHDIGQYVKHYERGRKYVRQSCFLNPPPDVTNRPVAELGGKARVMELITHPNSDVRYRALLSVQQLVSQPWITA